MANHSDIINDLESQFQQPTVQLDANLDTDKGQLFLQLDACRISRNSVLIDGDPGMGKTEVVHEYAESRGDSIMVLLGSQSLPEDFMGQPTLAEVHTFNKSGEQETIKVTEHTMLAWFFRIIEDHKMGITWTIFLDDLRTSTPEVQGAMLTMLQSRTMGNYRLPDSTLIVAASNPAEQYTAGYDLSAPTSNRFLHLEWAPPVSEWVNGFLVNWGKQMSPYESQLRAQIASFLMNHQMLAHNMPEDAEDRGGAWPSYRTWTKASETLAAAASRIGMDNVDAQITESWRKARYTTLKGFVGNRAAAEFDQFLQDDLPTAYHLLDNPGLIDPNWNNVQWMRVCYSMFALASTEPDEHWQRVIDFLGGVASKYSASRTSVASVVPRLLPSNVRPAGAQFPLALMTEMAPLFKASGLI